MLSKLVLVVVGLAHVLAEWSDDVSDLLQAQILELDGKKVNLGKGSAWHVEGQDAKGPRVWVGVLSSTSPQRRTQWRQAVHCGEKLRKAGIPYAFIVGYPIDAGRDLTVHMQGAHASDNEAKVADDLRIESETYGDMHFVPIPDGYLDLHAKTFSLLEYGYNLGAAYVVKTDDDVCLNTEGLMDGIHAFETDPEGDALYAGYYDWHGTEYASMRGRDNVPTPYMSGPGYVLSRNLVKAIVKDDEMHSILWAPYGSFDEDTNTGRWVEYARTHHNIAVQFRKISNMLSP